MATITPPSSFAQTKGTTGFSYQYTEEVIRQEITERLNVLQQGLVMGVGDLQGRGSDTVRVTRYGGIGYAERMTAMASETDPIVSTGHTQSNDTVTIGRYGLAKEQTYQDQILGRAEALGLEDMASRAPNSWLSTLRYLVAQSTSSFSSGSGTSGTVWTFDDELDLIASFHETEGFDTSMDVVTIRHPEQYSDFRRSIRNEPGLQNDAALMQALLGLRQGQAQGAFSFLGMRNFASFDVATVAGDHVGGAYVPGAISWVVASTLPVEPEDSAKTSFVPEFGIVLERKSTSEVATAKFVMNAWFGVANLDATLFPQKKITSIND